MVRRFAFVAVLALAACDENPEFAVYQPLGSTPVKQNAVRAPQPDLPRPSDADMAQFARGFLNSIQPDSVAMRREVCGYFYIDDAGQIAATTPRVGSFAGCDMPVPQQGDPIIASYHTHSAFAPGYDNEVPSAQDLLSDFQFAIDGYVSTPGGRVWHVDYGSRTTRQVCGLGCVYVDPGFRPVNEEMVRATYSVSDLQQRNNLF